MSVEITLSIVCDRCGRRITPEPEHRITCADSLIYDAKILAKRQGWISVSRGRYLPKTHYCAECCDGPPVKVKKIKRQGVKRIPTDVYDPNF